MRRSAFSLPLVLTLPLGLAACFGSDDKDTKPASACHILDVSPQIRLDATFVNPLISATYTAPAAGRCNTLVLRLGQDTVVPTRVLLASEQPNPEGGVVGSMTIEPTSDLQPSTSYGVFLDGHFRTTFITGTQRRGNFVKAEDVRVQYLTLPKSDRVAKDQINGLLTPYADALVKQLRIPTTSEPYVRDLLRHHLPTLAAPGAVHDVLVRRLVYRSNDADGYPVSLSGLLVFPVQAPGGPAVDYNGMSLVLGQRGALRQGEPAPSSGAHEMLAPAMLAAGKGHIFFAPDLIGHGESAALPQAFLIAKEAAGHTVDMLTAVREYFKQQHSAQPGTALNVFGVSQGAFSAIAALPALSPTATLHNVYGVSGPYDVRRTVDSALRAAAGEARDDYARDANLALIPGYLRLALDSLKEYQNFAYDPKTVFDDKLQVLPSFLTDYKNGKHKRLAAHLAVNSPAAGSQRLDATMARLRLYRYGADTLVASRNTDDMLAQLRAQRSGIAEATAGDCREQSAVVKEVVAQSTSPSTPHAICTPFVLNDFIGAL